MRKVPSWIKILFVFAVVYLLVIQPIPYYVEKPGQAFGLDDMVEVDGAYSSSPGELYITTIGIRQVTPLTALSGLLPFQDLVSEADLFGEINDPKAYDTIQQYYMESSGNTAIQVAFEAAEMDYTLVYNGVYVLQVLEESSFSEDLQVGDTVIAVDGHYFQSSHEFMDYIASLNVGTVVEIEFERDGEILEATGELIQLETGVAGIGIGLVDNTSLVTDPEVDIHSGSIGGPSAGLMFSLQIYDQLVEDDVIGQHKIAGTGTISPDGTVGRIGGAAKKVVAAEEEGVEYFFAPNDTIPEEVLAIFPETQTNYEEAVEAAKEINADLEVIPIATFSEALEFLNTLTQEEVTYLKDVHPIHDLSFNKRLLNIA